MKTNIISKIALIIFFMVMSCDEPETVVTNIINADGSVTRKIEMRNVKNIFNKSDFQVPYDSTWIVKDSIEVSQKGDTTWVKRAEKLFTGFEEINAEYKKDSGANKSLKRHVMLVKKFKWFNTEFRFSERIEKKVDYGSPVKEFLNPAEIEYLYSPESLITQKLNGPDSLKFRELKKSVDTKTDAWLTRTYISGWIRAFGRIINDSIIADKLKRSESEILSEIFPGTDETDSLWNNGILLRKFIGDIDTLRYKSESDSAEKIVLDELMEFKGYSVRIVMPGKLTSTNGFVDSGNVLLWPVKLEFFLTQPYEMWAVSKVRNTWAWIVSAMFVLFVITGVTLRVIRKG